MLKRLAALTRIRTTYQVGLLQDKAYRAMKREMTAALEDQELSTTEWAFMGLLYDKTVKYPSQAAEELGVEAAFITVMTRKLKKRGFVSEEKDQDDNRRRCLQITEAGKKFVAATEPVMRGRMRGLASGASPRALIHYLLMLERIITNAKNR